jgi:tRNA C32,U32 (ribose-2'-O)-methylase TrmJ
MLSVSKKELKREIFALYSTVFMQMKIYEYNYEKMGKQLIKNLQRIYSKIQFKNIDLFERGLEDLFKKTRHKDGTVTKLPEGHKSCK